MREGSLSMFMGVRAPRVPRSQHRGRLCRLSSYTALLSPRCSPRVRRRPSRDSSFVGDSGVGRWALRTSHSGVVEQGLDAGAIPEQVGNRQKNFGCPVFPCDNGPDVRPALPVPALAFLRLHDLARGGVRIEMLVWSAG